MKHTNTLMRVIDMEHVIHDDQMVPLYRSLPIATVTNFPKRAFNMPK